jgi:hypothetical protein
MDMTLETAAALPISTIELMTPKNLAELFNMAAAALNGRGGNIVLVKRFADKTAALKRTTQVIDAYNSIIAKEKAAAEPAAKTAKAPKAPKAPKEKVAKDATPLPPAEPRGSIASALREMINAGMPEEKIFEIARARFGRARIPNNAVSYYRAHLVTKRTSAAA